MKEKRKRKSTLPAWQWRHARLRHDPRELGRARMVNVKVYKGWEDGLEAFRAAENADPRFTVEWVETHLSDTAVWDAWGEACREGWEIAQDDARNVLPNNPPTVYSDGRSEGWACCDPDISQTNWPAWCRWARRVRLTADDTPYRACFRLYVDHFEPWAEEQRKHELALDAFDAAGEALYNEP